MHPPPVSSPRTARRRPGGWAAVASSLAWLLAGCASFDQEMNLAPFASRLSRAGGGTEFEAVAGAFRTRRPAPGSDVTEWAWRPLIMSKEKANGDAITRYLVPFGDRKKRGDDVVTSLLPIYRYARDRDDQGRREWALLIFPILLWEKNADGHITRALFPIGGVMESFLTWDKVTFWFFPIYAKTEQNERTTWHLFWPFISWSHERGNWSFRFWPFHGLSRDEDHERGFVLWPFFHLHRNDLRQPEDEREIKKGVLPFFGTMKRGSFKSWVVLWPFFGWSRDPESGFWSYDGPWPLVRIQRPGDQTDVPTRTRVWPFYSHYRDGGETGLESYWVAWPFLNQRIERYEDGERRAHYLIPVVQSWRRTDLAGNERRTWAKLWPLFQRYTDERAPEGPHSRLALPALNPLWHTPVMDDMYAWIWELYTREENGPRSTERVWGNIWRREVDLAEQRTYLSGLWSRRKYSRLGEPVRETSLLFGILRWRERPGRPWQLMLPAIPGPGWPLERMPETRIAR